VPKYKVITGKQCVEVEAKSRLDILERVADWNGICITKITNKKGVQDAKRCIRQEQV
jgi:hypothetical protein